MEDSFNVRVSKVFGSLPVAASSSSSSSADPSLWCLTDEEIERREWNRNKGSPEKDDESKPYPSNLDGFSATAVGYKDKATDDLVQELEDDLDDDDEEEEEEEEKKKGSGSRKIVRPDHYYDDEAWDIRSAIGQDCALDNEEEEDEYDKVATGRDAVDNLYLRDITDYEDDIDFYNELPTTLRDVNKDPRANHMAAKIRLKEDAEAAKYNIAAPALDTQIDISEDGVNLNSILKNNEDQIDSKSKKRVRFDTGCKDDNEKRSEGRTNILAMETSFSKEAQATKEASFLPQHSSGVPDYERNPSKYKHYTFDSSTDIDEASNQRAYADFLNLLQGPKPMESQDDISFELPKSVTFTPKKKLGDNTLPVHRNEFKNEPRHKKGFPIGIAAGDEQERGICAMEEDKPEPVASDGIGSSQRPGRRYRTKE